MKGSGNNSLEDVFDNSSPSTLTYRISHKNIKEIKFPSPQHLGTILFDSNLNCNLHCIYCHNHRDLNLVKEDDFLRFIYTQVLSTNTFQIGCAMEPTMDKRMLKFIEMISQSHAKPKHLFRLQTNGILLKEKDMILAKELGVNRLCVSIDTLNPEIHKYLRGGSDINTIIENIKNVRKSVPSLETWFITTVHSENIDTLDELAEFAVHIGITGMELRKMFYHSNSKIIKKHDDMKNLLLENKLFVEKTNVIIEKWDKKIKFYINDENKLGFHKKKEIS